MNAKAFDWAGFRSGDISGVRAIEALLPDLNGCLLVKRSSAELIEKVLKEGVLFPRSIYACDLLGEGIWSAETLARGGEADSACLPITTTFGPLPWDPAVVQVLVDIVLDDGKPDPVSPRAFVADAHAKLLSLGIRPVVAIELEFYILDGKALKESRVAPPPCENGRGLTFDQQTLSLDREREHRGILEALTSACRSQGLSAEGAVIEYGPGQLEINLRHTADVLAAADEAVLFKRTVREVASRLGVEATFMPKPYGEFAGSGLHIHMSLLDAKTGANLAEASIDPVLKPAIAGLVGTMSDFMAFFAPHANSYRRIAGSYLGAMTANWGFNHRGVSVRVPKSDAKNMRLEHRIAGAEANVYLVLGAALAGVYEGIKNNMPLIASVNDEEASGNRVPTGWIEALDVFEKSEVVRAHVSDVLRETFLAIKRSEIAKYNAVIPPTELTWMTRRF
ncbi:MAG: glutamine synthetase family protein [Hyphomicrobium sp.]